MARLLRESGGEYLYLSRWVHPAIGFVAGWVSLLAGFTGAIALSALTFERYLFPAGGWIAAGAIVVSVLLHGINKAPGAWLQNLAVTVKVLFLLLIIAVAATTLLPPNTTDPVVPSTSPPPFSIAAFMQSLMWISLSYAGFNAAVYVSGEARNARTVPIALLLGTLITMFLYVALNAVFVHAAPVDKLAGEEAVAAIAIASLDIDWITRVMQVVIPLALFTSVSAMILAGPRVYAQMANDGCLPRALRFPPTAEVPHKAIVFQGILALVVVAFASIRDLLGYLGFTLSISSALAVSSLFIVHHRGLANIALKHRVAAAAYIIMTVISALIGASLNPTQGIAGLLTLLVGLLAYALKRPGHA